MVKSTYRVDSLTKGRPLNFLEDFGHQRARARHRRVFFSVVPASDAKFKREVDDAGCLASSLVAHKQVLGDQSHFYLILILR